MLRRILVVIIPIIVIGICVILILPWLLTAKKYQESLSDWISTQSVEKQEEVSQEVYGSIGDGEYGGVLLTANRLGILVWGQGMPRWFRYISNDSVMSFFDLCRVIRQPAGEQEKRVSRQIFFDMPS